MAAQLVETLNHAFKIGDLRRRILYTLLAIVIYRIGAHVPVPGIDPSALSQLFSNGTIFGFLDILSGGALRNFTVFAMGIIPYINASIIMQLLTIVVPVFEQWSKEGDEGRKKLTEWTRYGTVVLGALQAIGVSIYLSRIGALYHAGLAGIAVTVITLTAGTVFLMWLGEQITEYGIGNGISLLIFAGIVSRLPAGAGTIYTYIVGGTIHIVNVVILLAAGLVVIAGVVLMQQGQRRIPVQYAKRVVGRRVYGGQSTHIPIRVNQAGVIPVIFAASLLAFPATVAQFFNGPIALWFRNVFSFANSWYEIVYFFLIVGFTFFYTAIIFNPTDVADNIKKYGGFIPGLRPGKPTAQYLERVIMRITLFGAVFLGLVAVLPPIFAALTNIPNLYFGGTALLIVVGVSLETMKQIEAHLVMRHYQGFMK